MKRIVIEKLFVYTLGFLFCFSISLKQGNTSFNAEQEFLNNISSAMLTYNYAETKCLTCDLKYIQDDNNIKFNYDVNAKEVKIRTIDAEFHLNYTSDLSNVYSLLSEIYSENIFNYDNEIQNMIIDYTTTGEEQMWQDLNIDRQITLRIAKTTSLGKDFQLYYSIMSFDY